MKNYQKLFEWRHNTLTNKVEIMYNRLIKKQKQFHIIRLCWNFGYVLEVVLFIGLFMGFVMYQRYMEYLPYQSLKWLKILFSDTSLWSILGFACILLFSFIIILILEIQIRKGWVARKKHCNSLDEDASNFAITVFTDFIATLSTKFILTDNFKEKLKKFIREDLVLWKANLGQLEDMILENKDQTYVLTQVDGEELTYYYTHGPKFNLKDRSRRLIINHEGCIYYLTDWDWNLDWDKFTHLYFSFKIIHPDGRVEEDVKYEFITPELR